MAASVLAGLIFVLPVAACFQLPVLPAGFSEKPDSFLNHICRWSLLSPPVSLSDPPLLFFSLDQTFC